MVPTLFYVAAGLALLALWSQDGRGVFLAGVCFLVGLGQMIRDDLTASPPSRKD